MVLPMSARPWAWHLAVGFVEHHVRPLPGSRPVGRSPSGPPVFRKRVRVRGRRSRFFGDTVTSPHRAETAWPAVPRPAGSAPQRPSRTVWIPGSHQGTRPGDRIDATARSHAAAIFPARRPPAPGTLPAKIPAPCQNRSARGYRLADKPIRHCGRAARADRRQRACSCHLPSRGCPLAHRLLFSRCGCCPRSGHP